MLTNFHFKRDNLTFSQNKKIFSQMLNIFCIIKSFQKTYMEGIFFKYKFSLRSVCFFSLIHYFNFPTITHVFRGCGPGNDMKFL